jgi:hypothetical protein
MHTNNSMFREISVVVKLFVRYRGRVSVYYLGFLGTLARGGKEGGKRKSTVRISQCEYHSASFIAAIAEHDDQDR